MLPQEVFISHANEDREFVDDLVAMLRRHGIPVWYSRTQIVAAREWHDEIGAALRRCDWFIVVLSPSSVDSVWVKRELLFVLQQAQYEDRIIPLIHQPCDVDKLSWTLSSYQRVDFTKSFDKGSRDLLRTWGLAYTS